MHYYKSIEEIMQSSIASFQMLIKFGNKAIVNAKINFTYSDFPHQNQSANHENTIRAKS